MPVDLKVPEMGESVTEVYIGQWWKKEGDQVEQDDVLVELESEKATLDLRAPAAGVLTKILKNSGEEAEVGEVIGQIDEAATQKAPKKSASRAEQKEEKSTTEKQPADEPKAAADDKTVAKETDKKADQKSANAKPKVALQRANEAAESGVLLSPKSVESNREEERVVMSPIRRRIASRLVNAQRNAALLTTFNEIDMSAVKQLRAQHGEAFKERHRVRLGFMPFFVKAAVEALRLFPELNAMIDGDDIVYRRYYDIGVAISSDKGLVVPVLRDADRMSFAQIEQAIEDLSKRARSGELKVEELHGGTFTITNGGVFGSLLSTPIVNPPQSGVLGMHAIQNRPIAVDNQIVIRPMMYVALSYDHRTVDGREAVTFLRRIKETIEEPARLLIDA
ncbi:MAG: 2-oxoglutarate dehydrogenase complex dihydrolipoyllysine-residue succinyltransferase [Planctomycetes bacterium]|nr:2-oxoglutarate dehydrogenase complex dihydrolipoyllysine-residue succinyltransferase [Planctomycetota bacterium]